MTNVWQGRHNSILHVITCPPHQFQLSTCLGERKVQFCVCLAPLSTEQEWHHDKAIFNTLMDKILSDWLASLAGGWGCVSASPVTSRPHPSSYSPHPFLSRRVSYPVRSVPQTMLSLTRNRSRTTRSLYGCKPVDAEVKTLPIPRYPPDS